ncbi:hypothetical protein GCM10009837_85560 [Streptomyces durmitorensis]
MVCATELLSAPLILVALVPALTLSRGVADWPEQGYDGWVLLGMVTLSLLPVIRLFLQTLNAGSIEVAGVSLSFAAASESAAEAVRTATLTENLDTPEDMPLERTSLRSILRALRRAHDSEVTVVDLRQGQTWWETRLFILIAGAARRDRTQAIAFVGERNGTPGTFLGWAPPSRLLAAHLRSDPLLSAAHERARAKTAAWQLGQPLPNPHASVTPSVMLPWGTNQSLPPVENQTPDPAFAFELYLQQNLDRPSPESGRLVTIQRLRELYEVFLVTDSIDAQTPDDAWAEVVLTASPRRFFAVTKAGKFKALIPRDALVAALVTRLVRAEDSPS